MPKTILVTGAAGFIGFHTANALCARGDKVIGLDNFSPYYDPKLKEARSAELEKLPNFTMIRCDILDRETTLAPAKATGNVFHFWRILHEGAGLSANANNPHIFDASKRSDPYPILAVVQTTALEPLFGPGKHPPYT